MAYRSIVAEQLLAALVVPIPSVASTFGGRIVTTQSQDPAGVDAPYLAIARHPGSVPRGVLATGTVPIFEAFAYDVAGWDEGATTDRIAPAMNDIDQALIVDSYLTVVVDGEAYRVSIDDAGELPMADPPSAGETPMVRLGKQYNFLVIGG